ncbi:hypothetical protein [Piscinibacter sp. HJYY11]|uniref:hypothetical protein n=1 Tax=Piscinibacter sp. HJYY11 TaxID=2801333 RepID=UPI0019202556|nr:hypothetical protein [Piscinibacter sp. HJYY11]MBL0729609.1 hypothetical protein [Piscinibacter sp. HJYY11]
MLASRHLAMTAALVAAFTLTSCGEDESSSPASSAPQTSTNVCTQEPGWTTPRPSAADQSGTLTRIDQPGSRLHYIDSTAGSDQTGEIYFWDGQQIIDARGSSTDRTGRAYGTDPMNPSSAVKPFRRWAYVGPRANGADVGQRGFVGSPNGGTRAGFPDWWLFARGRTFDLTQDLLSFEREANPGATTVNSSLSVPGGRSASERQIVGAYGDLCRARPRFVHPMLGFVTAIARPTSPLRHVAYLSLHFDGHDRSSGSNFGGVTMLYQTTASIDILFEDLWLDATSVNIGGGNAGQFTFRRVLLTDAFSPEGREHVQGLYYEGARQGRLRIEESILLRNGFRGDPALMTWPPSGSQVWNIYNRNLYVHGETDTTTSGLFDSVSMMGTSGDQFRPGMRVERNFFYQGYVAMGAHGGYPESEGATGAITDNVLQRFVGRGTQDNRGQPGWGFSLTSGAHRVEVARNVVTGAQHSASEYALQLSPLSWTCYAHTYRYATRDNHVHDNVFDSGSAAPIGIELGVVGESPAGCANYPGNGVLGNRIENNIFLSGSASESTYTLRGTRLASGDPAASSFAGNRLFSSRGAAATTLGWPAQQRTLKTYLQSRGVNVTSDDGFPEYFELATQLRRGQWRMEWHSRSLNNYFREGFGMRPIQ